ncbi:MarR family winged helix-turn-helix transcriptional regulator [Kitasatospora sp. NPDC057940]|uniref:MarR family winged helix-turn-helix transcriptional regulator n=1 Tax=Kitasatospora sp. NPDC057940 TaxID=3346285 RepID=UPI0036DE344B
MAAATPSRPRAARRASDLGITDGLVQLSFLVQGVLDHAADAHGLPVLQARLVGVLRDREPSMAQLANLLDLDKSSTTGLATRAERRGLVERVPVPEDRRAVRVRLTGHGRRLAEAFAAEVGQRLEQAVSGLTETNRKRLSQLASQVVQHDAAAHGTDLTPGAPGSRA